MPALHGVRGAGAVVEPGHLAPCRPMHGREASPSDWMVWVMRTTAWYMKPPASAPALPASPCSPSLGGTESLIGQPAVMTYYDMGQAVSDCGREASERDWVAPMCTQLRCWVSERLVHPGRRAQCAPPVPVPSFEPQGREEIGIGENLVRYSCGVEDVEDLWADLEQALDRI